MQDLLKELEQIISDVVKRTQREELFTRCNKGNRYYLKFDASFWYVECYDAFNYDFYWCLQFENYSDAINCYESEVNAK